MKTFFENYNKTVEFCFDKCITTMKAPYLIDSEVND